MGLKFSSSNSKSSDLPTAPCFVSSYYVHGLCFFIRLVILNIYFGFSSRLGHFSMHLEIKVVRRALVSYSCHQLSHLPIKLVFSRQEGII